MAELVAIRAPHRHPVSVAARLARTSGLLLALLLTGAGALAPSDARAQATYTITASSDSNGVIAPAGAVPVTFNTSQSFTLTPAAGYRVRDVKVDGVSVGPVSAYTFDAVSAAHSIVASFSPIPYPLVVLRADSSNGASRWPIPSSSGPWKELRHGYDCVVTNFLYNSSASGWAGDGSHASPYRLKWSGHEERGVIAAGSVPELQSVAPVTAALWFQSDDDGTDAAEHYLMEWVEPGDRGMSIAVRNNQLSVYLNGWVSVAALAPRHWYHVVVAKELDQVRVSVNGVRVYTGSEAWLGRQVSGLGIGTSTYRMLEGGYTQFGEYARGAIAQAEVWRGAWTDSETVARYQADRALYQPDPLPPPASAVLMLRAEQANGAGPYPAPGAGSPWRDLAGVATDATLKNFAGTAASGWVGSGTLGDPSRLQFDGVDDVVTVAAQAVSELQDPLAYSAGLWVRTPADVTTQQFLTEWLEGPGLHGGMSLDVMGGQLRVFLEQSGWVPFAPVQPNTWYQVAVAKQPGALRAYLNGARVYATDTPWIGAQTSEIAIGGSVYQGPGIYGEPFHGALGQYVVWNGALDDAGAITAFLADSTRFCDYAISASAGPDGSVTPSGTAEVPQHATRSYGIAAGPNRHIVDVLVDGVSVGPVTQYTFTDVTANHTLAASFAVNSYTVQASAGAGGAVSPAGAVSVAEATDKTFTITPNTGFHIVDVLVDGVSAGATSSYTFHNVFANHTLAASFAINSYTLSVTTAGTGSVARVPDQPGYTHGTLVQLTATPGPGQGFRGWSGDTITRADPLILPMIANRTLLATFAPLHTVTTSAGANGAVSPAGAQPVPEGDSLAIAILPATGYHVADVLVDGVSVGAVTHYTFPNITADHTLAASFAINQYALTIARVGSGTVAQAPALALYPHGSQVQLTATAATGYTFTGWSGDTTAATNPLTLTMVAPRNLTATFTINTYTITASAGAHGSIAPAGAVPVQHGASQSFTLTPDLGYHVADVLVDGASVGAPVSFKFDSVTTGHTIAASFAIDVHTVTATAGPHGSVTPAGAAPVNYGSDATFMFTPDTGYHVADVKVDGVSTGPAPSHTFTAVITEHTLDVSFAIDVYTITASSDSNGVIAPAGAVPVTFNTSQSFTLTPAAGYRVRDVKVDGVSVGPVSAYTFDAVSAAHSIVASFSPIPYPLVVLRADSSNGASRWPIPSSSGPWKELRHGYDCVVTNFLYNSSASGWAGDGSHASPYRLKWSGHEERGVIAAGSVPELQSVAPVTAALWFQSDDDGTDAAEHYLMEWVEPGDRGMSIAVRNNQLSVYLNGWVSVAALAPRHWYHVVVAKELDQVRVSVNGVRVYTGSEAWLGRQVSGLGIGTSTYRMLEGGYTQFGEYARGAIAQAEVWRGAWTDSETVARYQADRALYQPDPLPPPASAVLMLRAEQANGAGPYPAPGAGSPWRDLAGVATDATLKNFAGTAASGWVGSGTLGDPSRLQFDGVDDVVTVAAQAVSELQDPLAYSAGLWVRTPADVTTQQFLTEWLEGPGLHGGMSLDVMGGQLRVFLEQSGWVPFAPVQPNTWYQVAVAKQPGALRAYLNGARVYATDTPWIGAQTSEIAIGGSVYQGPGIYGEPFHGALGQYVVWNGALDDAGAITAFLADSTRFCDYAISASAGPGGAISDSGVVAVAQHANRTFAFLPAPGYGVADVQVDGVSVGVAAQYTFTDVTANHTLAVSFVRGLYTLAIAVVDSGTVAKNPDQPNYLGGTTVQLTAIPVAHHTFVGWSGDTTTTSNPLTLTMVSNRSLTATFALVTLPIAADAGPNGSITPSGSVAVGYGTSQSFAIAPAPGYHVVDVLVDGVSVGAVTQYTFTNVVAAHAIHARFAQDDTTPPAVAVLYPNGNESLVSGTHVNITWTATDAGGVWNVDLAWSADGGAHWIPIANAIPNSGSFDWVVPDSNTYKARVLVTARDSTGNKTPDSSDARFFIHAASTGVGDGPHTLALAGSWPNPAVDRFVVAFSLGGDEAASLELIDPSGRRVRSADLSGLGAGPHRYDFQTGGRLPSGVYLLRLNQGGRTLTTKVVLTP